MSDHALPPPGGTASPGAVSDSARRPIMLGLGLVLFFFGGMGTWAAFAPLNSAAIAPGIVKVEGNRKSVQHLDGGIISKLYVKDGDRVETGQLLIALDDSQAAASEEIFAKQSNQMRAQEARLIAERDGKKAIQFPAELVSLQAEPSIASLLNSQINLFNSRRNALEGQVKLQRQKILQLQEQIKGAQAQLDAQTRQLKLINEEAEGVRELYGKGYAPKTRILALDRNAAQLEGSAGDITSSIGRFRQQISETELQILQITNDQATQIATELRDTQTKSYDVEPRLQAARDTLQRIEIRSPASGYVVGLTAFTVGGVIAKGEKVMDIVPDKDALIVEANINVDDINDVHPGMRTEVHLTSYKQRIIPVIHGELKSISADRLTDPRTGVPYFTGVVKVDEADLAASPEIQLYPGMPATVMIPTGDRTALQYLVRPFYTAFDHAFRER